MQPEETHEIINQGLPNILINPEVPFSQGLKMASIVNSVFKTAYSCNSNAIISYSFLGLSVRISNLGLACSGSGTLSFIVTLIRKLA